MEDEGGWGVQDDAQGLISEAGQTVEANFLRESKRMKVREGISNEFCLDLKRGEHVK